MSQPLFVTPDGRPFDLAAAHAAAKAQAKPQSRGTGKGKTGALHEDFISLGFSVEGLTHAMLADARDARQKAIASYELDCASAKAEHKPMPKRPLPFDEETWRNTAKRVKVVSRPFEIRSSAEQCREMALRSGYIVAEVVELRRERK